MFEEENNEFPSFYQEKRGKIIEYTEKSTPREVFGIIRKIFDYPE